MATKRYGIHETHPDKPPTPPVDQDELDPGLDVGDPEPPSRPPTPPVDRDELDPGLDVGDPEPPSRPPTPPVDQDELDPGLDVGEPEPPSRPPTPPVDQDELDPGLDVGDPEPPSRPPTPPVDQDELDPGLDVGDPEPPSRPPTPPVLLDEVDPGLDVGDPEPPSRPPTPPVDQDELDPGLDVGDPGPPPRPWDWTPRPPPRWDWTPPTPPVLLDEVDPGLLVGDPEPPPRPPTPPVLLDEVDPGLLVGDPEPPSRPPTPPVLLDEVDPGLLVGDPEPPSRPPTPPVLLDEVDPGLLVGDPEPPPRPPTPPVLLDEVDPGLLVGDPEPPPPRIEEPPPPRIEEPPPPRIEEPPPPRIEEPPPRPPTPPVLLDEVDPGLLVGDPEPPSRPPTPPVLLDEVDPGLLVGDPEPPPRPPTPPVLLDEVDPGLLVGDPEPPPRPRPPPITEVGGDVKPRSDTEIGGIGVLLGGPRPLSPTIPDHLIVDPVDDPYEGLPPLNVPGYESPLPTAKPILQVGSQYSALKEYREVDDLMDRVSPIATIDELKNIGTVYVHNQPVNVRDLIRRRTFDEPLSSTTDSREEREAADARSLERAEIEVERYLNEGLRSGSTRFAPLAAQSEISLDDLGDTFYLDGVPQSTEAYLRRRYREYLLSYRPRTVEEYRNPKPEYIKALSDAEALDDLNRARQDGRVTVAGEAAVPYQPPLDTRSDTLLHAIPGYGVVRAFRQAGSPRGPGGIIETESEQKSKGMAASLAPLDLAPVPIGGALRFARVSGQSLLPKAYGGRFIGATTPASRVLSVRAAPTDLAARDLTHQIERDLARQGYGEGIIGGRYYQFREDPLSGAIRKENPGATLTFTAAPDVEKFAAGGPIPESYFPSGKIKPPLEQGQFLSPGYSVPRFADRSAFGQTGTSPGVVAYGDDLSELTFIDKYYKTGREVELVAPVGLYRPPVKPVVGVGSKETQLYLPDHLREPTYTTRVGANVRAIADLLRRRQLVSSEISSPDRIAAERFGKAVHQLSPEEFRYVQLARESDDLLRVKANRGDRSAQAILDERATGSDLLRTRVRPEARRPARPGENLRLGESSYIDRTERPTERLNGRESGLESDSYRIERSQTPETLEDDIGRVPDGDERGLPRETPPPPRSGIHYSYTPTPEVVTPPRIETPEEPPPPRIEEPPPPRIEEPPPPRIEEPPPPRIEEPPPPRIEEPPPPRIEEPPPPRIEEPPPPRIEEPPPPRIEEPPPPRIEEPPPPRIEEPPPPRIEEPPPPRIEEPPPPRIEEPPPPRIEEPPPPRIEEPPPPRIEEPPPPRIEEPPPPRIEEPPPPRIEEPPPPRIEEPPPPRIEEPPPPRIEEPPPPRIEDPPPPRIEDPPPPKYIPPERFDDDIHIPPKYIPPERFDDDIHIPPKYIPPERFDDDIHIPPKYIPPERFDDDIHIPPKYVPPERFDDDIHIPPPPPSPGTPLLPPSRDAEPPPARPGLYPAKVQWVGKTLYTLDTSGPEAGTLESQPITNENTETFRVVKYTGKVPPEETHLASHLKVNVQGRRVSARQVKRRRRNLQDKLRRPQITYRDT